MTHTAKWTVSLSNGETLHEGKGDYTLIPGEKSPWVRLQEYILDNNLAITTLGIYRDSGARYNLPSMSANPRFRAFHECEKPIAYNQFKQMARDVIGGTSGDGDDVYTVVEAIYPTYSLQLWADNRTDTVWTLSVPYNK